jgi:hypothetical protein
LRGCRKPDLKFCFRHVLGVVYASEKASFQANDNRDDRDEESCLLGDKELLGFLLDLSTVKRSRRSIFRVVRTGRLSSGDALHMGRVGKSVRQYCELAGALHNGQFFLVPSYLEAMMSNGHWKFG